MCVWGGGVLFRHYTSIHLLCLQLEETQTKRHDQLVEQYNELLQEIQDLKPKVENANQLPNPLKSLYVLLSHSFLIQNGSDGRDFASVLFKVSDVNISLSLFLQLQGAVEADFQEKFHCLPGEIQEFLQERRAEVRANSKSRPNTPHETLSEDD